VVLQVRDIIGRVTGCAAGGPASVIAGGGKVLWFFAARAWAEASKGAPTFFPTTLLRLLVGLDPLTACFPGVFGLGWCGFNAALPGVSEAAERQADGRGQ